VDISRWIALFLLALLAAELGVRTLGPRRTRFLVESGLYFLRHGPTGIKAPRRNQG
jgi:hypothetical protein